MLCCCLVWRLPCGPNSCILRRIAADAQWFVHSDSDQIRGSPVIERAYRAVAEEWPDQAEGQVDWLHDEFGLDLQSGLH